MLLNYSYYLPYLIFNISLFCIFKISNSKQQKEVKSCPVNNATSTSMPVLNATQLRHCSTIDNSYAIQHLQYNYWYWAAYLISNRLSRTAPSTVAVTDTIFLFFLENQLDFTMKITEITESLL